MGTPKRLRWTFGADDDKVVLASTGREAYAGGGFHRGAATTHATRHTQCAWTDAWRVFRGGSQLAAVLPSPFDTVPVGLGQHLAVEFRVI